MQKYLRRRAASFRYAFLGIWWAIRNEPNFQIHLMALVTVLTLGIIFKLSPGEWCLQLLAGGLVLSMELVNTAIEKLADACHPAENRLIKTVKDAAAGAVFIAALFALAVGLIIYLPRLIAFISI